MPAEYIFLHFKTPVIFLYELESFLCFSSSCSDELKVYMGDMLCRCFKCYIVCSVRDHKVWPWSQWLQHQAHNHKRAKPWGYSSPPLIFHFNHCFGHCIRSSYWRTYLLWVHRFRVLEAGKRPPWIWRQKNDRCGHRQWMQVGLYTTRVVRCHWLRPWQRLRGILLVARQHLDCWGNKHHALRPRPSLRR